jgi:hypothetical protein
MPTPAELTSVIRGVAPELRRLGFKRFSTSGFWDATPVTKRTVAA